VKAAAVAAAPPPPAPVYVEEPAPEPAPVYAEEPPAVMVAAVGNAAPHEASFDDLDVPAILRRDRRMVQ
jgi:hypothetical protein